MWARVVTLQQVWAVLVKLAADVVLKNEGVSINGRRRDRTIISINEKSVLDKEKLIEELIMKLVT